MTCALCLSARLQAHSGATPQHSEQLYLRVQARFRRWRNSDSFIMSLFLCIGVVAGAQQVDMKARKANRNARNFLPVALVLVQLEKRHSEELQVLGHL